jgi:y4mF family transcriptional regulator
MAEFILSKNTNGLYYFRLTANNGQILLTSEGYVSKVGCLNAVHSVKSNGKDQNRYDKRTTSSGKYYFNLKATNGQIIGTSEIYETAASRDNAIKTMQSFVTDTLLNDETVMELIDLVKEKRKQLGLTQQQLAEKAGVGLRFLRELEQGKNTLRIDKVNQVLKLFGYEMGPVLIKKNNLINEES